MCSLSLENVDCGPFCNDALEVEDKVCELQKKKMITQEDRSMPI